MAAQDLLILLKLSILSFFLLLVIVNGQSINDLPEHMKGDWYSYESGAGVDTTLSRGRIESRASGVSQQTIFNGDLVGVIKMTDSDSHEEDYDIRAMFQDARCYICYEFRYRTPNVLQYAKTTCRSRMSAAVTPQTVCDMLGSSDTLQYTTMFRVSLKKVNCKTTFEGVFHFTYLSREGGGGVCDNSKSLIEACQEPGSQYVDNEVFTMGYRLCPGISSSASETVRFQCLGSWTDDNGNIWAAVSKTGTTVKEEMYRCLLTNEDQQRNDLKKRYVMSIKPECSSLKGVSNGPIELVLSPEMSEKQLTEIQPSCNLPADFAGNWFTSGEYDSNVKINNTHIFFFTKIDQYHFRETYFTCQQSRESRYLMTAITRGRCEVDYICFDFMPRQYNVIRYRMAKPFRMSKRPDVQDESDQSLRDDKASKFLEACSWSAFNFNERGWKYYTFILDPPNPVPCPIAGVYTFKQFGLPSEKYKTRIRGITERPRMQIDCRKYESQLAVCSRDLKKINIDTERCSYVDMIGRPIGEYDIADHELACVGYWMEDFKSYLLTYDEEDPNSRYRCWVYKRLDFKTIIMSKASRSSCNAEQTAHSYESAQGASLALELHEFEREFDECPQWFSDGRQKEGWRDETRMAILSATSTSPCLLTLVVVALVWTLIR